MNVTLDDYKLSCELSGHSADVRALASGKATAEGEIVITGSRDKTTKLWKSTTGKEYSEVITFQDHKKFVASVCYLPNEKWVCTGSNDATVCIYNEGAYVPILTLVGHTSTVCSIAAAINKQSVITGSWDFTARIWQIDQLGSYTFITLRGHEAAIWSVATMINDKKYITGSADKTIYYWNEKGDKLRMLKGHTDCVRGLIALSDNSLISCSNDATIRYWNEDSECVNEMSGHTNYIYAIAQNKALGNRVIVSCGEDSTLRMWNVETGQELGAPIIHPAQSIWAVCCLSNGDILTGSSDGIVRVFTKDAKRFADKAKLNELSHAVAQRQLQMNEDLGGIKKTDLPGPESLLTEGNREGQTKMVRHSDGNIKCYLWEANKWTLVGDVTGASGGTQESSGKVLHEGKEYDYVFSVDIEEGKPPLKLPYNQNEDPWHTAQNFIHRHNLPQAYLEQVANFIVKNAKAPIPTIGLQEPTTSGYQDPFTGGSRYVPGMSNTNLQTGGNVDPFTGGSSYSIATNTQANKFDAINNKHFPVSKYALLDNCDAAKILVKLREFNSNLKSENGKVSDELLQGIIVLTKSNCDVDRTAIDALKILLRWPTDVLFPVLDVARLAVRNETIFAMLNSNDFLQNILAEINSSPPNQLMIIRCLTNIMSHAAGRAQVENRLPTLIKEINTIKSGSSNLQIAIATLYLNITISQTLGLAIKEKCIFVTEGLVELLKWATDLEACYRTMQAIGNLTTTPFGREMLAFVSSVDYVMDKLRNLTYTQQTGAYLKINSVGKELLATFQ